MAETTGVPHPKTPARQGDTLIFTRNNMETDAGLRGEGSVGPPEFVEILRAPEIADDTEAMLQLLRRNLRSVREADFALEGSKVWS